VDSTGLSIHAEGLGERGRREEDTGESFILWWIERDSWTAPVFQIGMQETEAEYHSE